MLTFRLAPIDECPLQTCMKRFVAAERMSAVGRGQEAPVADNRKEEGQTSDRRMEVVRK